MPESLISINGDTMQTIELLFTMSLITLLPSALMMMTSFTRIVIVMSLLRNALGLQQTPPNSVLIGISIFLTLFIMNPEIKVINETAYQPYLNEEIDQSEALDRASSTIKEFMLRQTELSSVDLFMSISVEDAEAAYALSLEGDMSGYPLTVVIPAFMASELKEAFSIGMKLFIPFLLIDIVVSSILMSMGMIMLPPATISLPFKLLIFLAINGWELLFANLAKGFF